MGDGLTVAGLYNHFLIATLRKVEAGELMPRLFAEYKEVAGLRVSGFGGSRSVEDLAADNFGQLRATMVKKWDRAAWATTSPASDPSTSTGTRPG